jgi:hypothetical protein
MRFVRRWIIGPGVVAFAAALAGLAGSAAAAGAAAAAPAALQQSGGVLPQAAKGTPRLTKTGSTEDKILQMAQCGGTMYAVGTFSSITQNKVPFPRSNIFSFEAAAPFTITSWAPSVNGQINSIAFNGTDCSHAYIGGAFTSVNGTAVSRIAKIDTTTGAVDPAFAHNVTGGEVQTLLAVHGHLLVGGNFGSVNGGKHRFFASVNPATGKDDGFLQLHITGHYHYCDPSTGKCTHGTHSEIDKQQLSHNGQFDLVMGNFTSVGGKARQQIFMLDLAADPAAVTGWTSPEFDGSKGNLPGGYPYQCSFTEAWYIRAAAWSPGDSTVYIATTGVRPWNVPASQPRSGLCDAVAAFPATHASVLHNWVEYSGCDSYYSVAADNAAVYAAGHPRWAENNACNKAGSTAIADPGLQGFHPNDGTLWTNSSGGPLYTMTRANASNMLITGAGLWIGSTNRFTSNECGNVVGTAGICFLPYP